MVTDAVYRDVSNHLGKPVIGCRWVPPNCVKNLRRLFIGSFIGSCRRAIFGENGHFQTASYGCEFRRFESSFAEKVDYAGYARTILFDFAKLMEVVRDGLVAKCREILVANLDFYTHAIEQLSRIEKFYMVGKDLDAGFVGLFLLQKLRLRRSIVVTDVNVLIKFYTKASVFHICRL